MKIFALCKPYLKAYKPSIITYLTISVFVGLFAMVNPYLIGDFVDNLIDGGSMTVVFRFSIIFASINIMRLIFNYITMIIYTKTQTRAAYSFSQEVVKHIQKLSVSFVDKKETNYLSQVVNGDANQLVIFCITVLNSIILNTIYIVMPIVIMFWLNPYISGVLTLSLFVYILIYKLFQKPLFKRSMSLREKQNGFFTKLLEQLKFTRFIKIHVIGDLFKKQMDENLDGLLSETLKMQKLSFAYTSLDTLVSTVVQISLFIFGGYLILNGQFTVGMFTIFTMYFNMMLGAVKYFFNFGKSYQDNMVSYTRLSDILNTPAETIGEISISSINKIELKNLSFAYENGKLTVENLSYTFSKGKIYCLEGRNGAGKSTLVSLIMGLYIDEFKGDIFVNEIKMNNLNMPFVRSKLIGVAEQEPVLLNSNLEENINLQNFEITHDNKKLYDILNINELLKRQKNTALSGGEKQKIAIVRTLLKNPDLMIFDEPTSALDESSANNFMEYLKTINKDKIVIVITHDVFVKKLCDEVLSF